MSKSENTLIQYQWKGLTRTGQTLQGIIEAKSLILAKVELRKQGLTSLKINKKRKKLWDPGSRKITGQDITLFSRQLATMIQAGIPLIQAFDIVGKGMDNKRMKEMIDAIKKDVETGTTLTEAMHKFPAYFNDLFCNLIDAGEKSGSLDNMLDRVATYKEKVESIKKKIKKALTYPIAVLIIAFIVTAALLIFVVPQFQSLFAGFGAKLPALTLMVIKLSEIFQKDWYLIFGGVGGLIYTFIYFKNHSPRFVHTLDRVLLKIPVIGPIIINATIARFSRTLAITFAAGLPLVEALKSVAGATGNIIYAEATTQIGQEVATGTRMNIAIERTNLFPSMVIQMIAIGEESGTLEKMLSKIADFYEAAVDNDVDSLSSLLEPIIMSILGVLVGGLVIAMYLPIFKLGSVV